MQTLNTKAWTRSSALLIGCIFAIAVGPAARAQDPPRYKVDASWPKEFPNNWILGRVGGIAVDKDDHIWVLQSPTFVLGDAAAAAQTPPLYECCRPAPAVLEFDTDGNFIRGWGGRGYVPDWPSNEIGLDVDGEGNIWMGGEFGLPVSLPNGIPGFGGDRQVLKFSPEGKLLLEIGHTSKEPANNQDTSMLGGPGRMTVDEVAHEVYIADGFLNKRVVVYDSNTGAFKRGWGAYGIPLSQIDNAKFPPYDPSAPPAKQFNGAVNDVRISVDGLVYVADRTGDRVQVFTKQGKFLKEFHIAPETRGRGTAMTMAFSHDSQQKYLLVGDGGNCVIWILNRNDGTTVGKFGHRGYNAGQFYFIQDMAMDSHGNLYTGEVNYNNRIQKFVLQP